MLKFFPPPVRGGLAIGPEENIGGIVGKGECKESTLVEVGVSSFYSYSLAIYIIVHC